MYANCCNSSNLSACLARMGFALCKWRNVQCCLYFVTRSLMLNPLSAIISSRGSSLSRFLCDLVVWNPTRPQSRNKYKSSWWRNAHQKFKSIVTLVFTPGNLLCWLLGGRLYFNLCAVDDYMRARKLTKTLRQVLLYLMPVRPHY